MLSWMANYEPTNWHDQGNGCSNAENKIYGSSKYDVINITTSLSILYTLHTAIWKI